MSKTYRKSSKFDEIWPLKEHQDASLEELVQTAYANEELFGELVYSAVDELEYRGIREDQLYHFVTWGDA